MKLIVEMFHKDEKKPEEGRRIIVDSQFGIIEGRYINGTFMNNFMDSEIPYVSFWGYWPSSGNIQLSVLCKCGKEATIHKCDFCEEYDLTMAAG